MPVETSTRTGPNTRRVRTAAGGALVLLAALLPGQMGRVGPAEPEPAAVTRGAQAVRSGELEIAWAELVNALDRDPDDARLYRDLADVAIRRGASVAAESIFRRHAELGPRNPGPHYALGKLAYLRGDYTRAREEALAALRRDARHGYSRLLLGLVEYSGGRPQTALRHWAAARREFTRAGDLTGEALARNNLAMVRLDLHEYERAREEYERALHLQRSLRNPEGQRLALANLGLALVDLGRYDEALLILRESRELARRLSDPHGEARALEFLCDARQRMGDYAAALATADTLLELAKLTDNRTAEIAGLLGRATAWNDLGDPLAALEVVGRGLALAESIGHPRYRSALLLTRGETELLLGRRSHAALAFAQCESIARDAGVEANAAVALAGLAQVARQDGDTTRARTLGESALALCRRIGYVEGEGQQAGLLAELALARGDRARAEELVERSLQLARRVGRQVDVGRALGRRARIRLATGKAARALEDAREGARIADLVGSPDVGAICAVVIGDILRDRDVEAAQAAYGAALDRVEQVRGRLRLEELKAGYLQDRRELYYRAADLWLARGRPEEAFRVSERFRARSLRDELAAERRVEPDSAAQARSWSEISSVLAPGEAVVEYFLGTEASLCFLISQGGVLGERLALTEGRAAAAIDTLRRSLSAPRSLMTLSFDEPMARRLGAVLVDPIRSGLAGIHLLHVVPDAALHALPFEVLLLAPSAGAAAPESSFATAPASPLYASLQGLRFLGAEVAIDYLPAASLLGRRAAPRSHRSDTLRQELLVIGGNVGGPRRAASEVARIGRLLPEATLRTGAAATERSFKELGPSHRLLHISAHGAVDAAAPLLSRLRLAPDPEGREDGDLHAYEVLPLRLSCDLVTLSACESGLGKVYAGEGVLGMARAFLRAGAQSALVSLWRVNDEATARFMEQFYARYLRGVPAAEAVRQAKLALRAESIRSADGREISLAHPFFWAPFVLVDGGGADSGFPGDRRSEAGQSR